MRILAMECSASPVSAAVICDGKVIGFSYSNIKLTHSQTLFPIIKSTLDSCKLAFRDIDAVSVSVGPGSFTGLRIGISSAKGLAEPKGLKCVGVSTLLAAAYMFLGGDAVICPVIDARRGQVYNAVFDVCGKKVSRITDDRALMIEDLKNELAALREKTDKRIILCCDAANAVFDSVKDIGGIRIAPESLLYQTAVGVGLYANAAVISGEWTDAAGLEPVYLKLPQAERELKAKRRED
ncbi:MAG: tRNA (adenosine(37)-N6)-threonylcarbamoyltransferase complex dimerization subunit type 1 TsaB [Clostridia bacterium]|nr:tRNA (adenosine(37)-N6)-threonylcarbamoyltransferase complex dimerization subunit type 1 TsaB [Clostridia bacterium]